MRHILLAIIYIYSPCCYIYVLYIYFWISSASIRSLPFLHFIVPIFGWNFPLIFPILLKRSHLSPSVVFLYFFALFIEEGLLVSLAILWSSALSWMYLSLFPLLFTSLLSSAICKVASDHHFAFLLTFSLEWSCSLCPEQYYKPLSIALQALCLLDLIPWIYLSLHCILIADLSSTWLA